MKEDKVITYRRDGKRRLDRKSFDKNNKKFIEDTRENATRTYIKWSLMLLEIMLVVALFIKIDGVDILSQKDKHTYILMLVIFNFLLLISFKNKVMTIIMSMLSMFISVGCVIGLIVLFKTNEVINKLNSDMSYETVQMSLLVPKDDKASSIKDVGGYNIEYVVSDKQVYKMIRDIDKQVTKKVNYSTCSNFVTLADDLLRGQEEAILLNKAYIDVINEIEGYNQFSKKVKEVYTIDIKVNNKEFNIDDKEVDNEKFIVYISGIDSYGSINVVSRSDVNILAVVNTRSDKIQLINTPRDYFVELPIGDGDIQDKLNHAGIYGVNTSIGTLENLYDIKIDYYFRINFSGFKKIIDTLGGVEVYSEYAFTGKSGSYNKGVNVLSGARALGFARERYAFSQGDIQRGNNQMAVIKAVIDKMSKKEFLRNYNKVLKELSGCFQTDMSTEVIYDLVREGLANKTSWNVQSMSVTGRGDMKKTYSMGKVDSYVMIPSATDINIAKRTIKDTLND